MNPFLSHSSEETEAFGHRFGKQLRSGDVILFYGELGAGKTTFIKGLVNGVTGLSSSFVQSPTFNYLNIYEGLLSVFHFDLYRLKNIDQFLSAGFDEFLGNDGICCVEWAERLEEGTPPFTHRVYLKHEYEDSRSIWIQS